MKETILVLQQNITKKDSSIFVELPRDTRKVTQLVHARGYDPIVEEILVRHVGINYELGVIISHKNLKNIPKDIRKSNNFRLSIICES